jgi:hypothetical protein
MFGDPEAPTPQLRTRQRGPHVNHVLQSRVREPAQRERSCERLFGDAHALRHAVERQGECALAQRRNEPGHVTLRNGGREAQLVAEMEAHAFLLTTATLSAAPKGVLVIGPWQSAPARSSLFKQRSRSAAGLARYNTALATLRAAKSVGEM